MTRDAKKRPNKRSTSDGKVQNEDGDLQQGVRVPPSGKKLEQREKGRIPRSKTLPGGGQSQNR